MTARIARIRRHPIKSLSGEDVGRTTLSAARPLPGDRHWALLTEAGEAHAGPDPRPGRWLPKSCFLRGAAEAALQAIEGGWGDDPDPAPGVPVTLRHPDQPPLCFDPATEGGRLVEWVSPLWPAERPRPTRLVAGPTAWTDVNRPWISILSQASLADLETRLGRPLGIARWRANLWVEGWPAWAERDLVGQVLTVGTAELRVTEPIGRCPATSADSRTGRIDIDMPEALKALFGNSDFGIYAEVVTGGTIAVGDRIGP